MSQRKRIGTLHKKALVLSAIYHNVPPVIYAEIKAALPSLSAQISWRWEQLENGVAVSAKDLRRRLESKGLTA